jgi:hypothetical protein
MTEATNRGGAMPKTEHPRGCQCDRGACKRARIAAELQPWERSRAYFQDLTDPYAAVARRQAAQDATHQEEVDRSIDELLARQFGPAGEPARQRLAGRAAAR